MPRRHDRGPSTGAFDRELAFDPSRDILGFESDGLALGSNTMMTRPDSTSRLTQVFTVVGESTGVENAPPRCTTDRPSMIVSVDAADVVSHLTCRPSQSARSLHERARTRRRAPHG